ncbi:MAG: hypothetical protein JJD92_05350 [Frankiaceae bacterium]|nr:hypothetical protein [Frankiaceae bacterium]
MTTQEQRWKIAERSLDVQAAKRIRRTPGVTIGILAGLVLAVGVTAAVDLRRLQTPRGAALAWSEAATFGDCRTFLSLSRPNDPLAERRTDDEICRALRSATEQARADSTRISVEVTSVDQRGGTATVSVAVRGPAGVRATDLELVRRGDDWLVLRQPGCEGPGCL